MGNRSVIGVRGLNTSDNPLELEPGTLVRADNVVVRNRGTVEPRTGETQFSSLSGGEKAVALYARWNNAVVSHGSSGTVAINGTLRDARPAPLADRVRMKFAEARGNLYYTTADGVRFFYATNQSGLQAGVPRAPDLDFVASALAGNPDAGWMPADTQVAGKAVFGTRDANGNLKLGAPSGPLILTNPANQTIAIGGLVRTGGNTVTVTFPAAHGYRVGDVFALAGSGDANFANGNKTVVSVPSPTTLTYTEAGGNVASTTTATSGSGAKNVLWRIPLPPDVTTSHFFQFHRGAVSAGAGLAPDDEFFLVFEGAITSGDITAGYIDYTDRTPESVLGLFGSEPLYTNANTGDGALAARFRPPRAVDIVWWDNRMWFANTKDVARRTITLLGIGSPSGLQDGDTVTVTVTITGNPPVAEVFTARTSPAAANDFQLYTDGSASQNIERTARALVAKIHTEHAQANAYYASGPNDAPGAIQVESFVTDVGFVFAASLSITASRVSAWSPSLPATGETDTRTNGLSYSEASLPESVPLLNYLTVGASGVEVVRILPLRDKLLVMTFNGGLWLVSGPAPYRIDPLDPTVNLRQPDTAVTHSGLVYAYTNHGVVAISDAGVRIVSQPIEESLKDWENRVGFLAVAQGLGKAFALSRETLHEYQLFLPANSGNTTGSEQAFLFNSMHEAWTRRTGARMCAAESLYGSALYGDADEAVVLQERHVGTDFSTSGLADKTLSRTLSSYTGNVLTLDSVASLAEGDLITQGSGVHQRRAVIESIDTATNRVTIPVEELWTAGSVSVHKAFACNVQFAPDTQGQPNIKKQVRGAMLHFKRLTTRQWDQPNPTEPGQVNATFSTEQHPYEEPVVRVDRAGWGLQPAGTSPWGDPLGPADERVAVPQDFQRARQLKLGFTSEQAGCDWELCGYSLESEPISERSR
jgi:hypothetical protein